MTGQAWQRRFGQNFKLFFFWWSFDSSPRRSTWKRMWTKRTQKQFGRFASKPSKLLSAKCCIIFSHLNSFDSTFTFHSFIRSDLSGRSISSRTHVLKCLTLRVANRLSARLIQWAWKQESRFLPNTKEVTYTVQMYPTNSFETILNTKACACRQPTTNEIVHTRI